jgi:ceramide glucosyltransferase
VSIIGDLVASLWLACTVLALTGCGQALFARWAVQKLSRRLQVRARPGPERLEVTGRPLPSVTILKPLHGAEPDLAANLASFLEQGHGAPVQVILGLCREGDPAEPIARKLVAEHAAACAKRGLVAEVVVDTTRHGSNGKVSNLVNMTRLAWGETILLADSDIAAPKHYLRAVLEALALPGVGAVTCVYHGVSDGSPWSRLTALMIDWHFLPNVLVGLETGLAKPCMGSTIALRRDTLTRIGGFEAFKDQLADDYEIGHAVRGLGLKVAVPPMLVGHSDRKSVV